MNVQVLLMVFLPFVHASWKSKCKIPSEWIRQADNVCYKTQGHTYGSFTVLQDCELFAIRLEHVSGDLNCNTADHSSSRWGCKEIGFETVLLKDHKLWYPNESKSRAEFDLPGFNLMDDVVVYKKRANVTKGEEMQIAYGEDFENYKEGDNGNRQHCVHVDFSCIV